MTQTQPQFKPGDRFWTHYDYKWGSVVSIHHTVRDAVHGVTGDKLPDTTWYDVRYDDGGTSLLDDAHGNWEMARMVPPHIAKRFGYGDDPNSGETLTTAAALMEQFDAGCQGTADIDMHGVLHGIIEDILNTLELALKSSEGDDVLAEVKDYIVNHYEAA